MHNAFSSSVLCPKAYLWEFFQDPFAAILTFFNQYKNAQAVDKRQLAFNDGDGTIIEATVKRKENSTDQSEVSVTFTAEKWGELVVMLTLTEVDENKTDCQFVVDLAGMTDENKMQIFSQSLKTRLVTTTLFPFSTSLKFF